METRTHSGIDRTTRYRLARVLFDSGYVEEAVNELTQVVRDQPNGPADFLSLTACRDLGDLLVADEPKQACVHWARILGRLPLGSLFDDAQRRVSALPSDVLEATIKNLTWHLDSPIMDYERAWIIAATSHLQRMLAMRTAAIDRPQGELL